MGRFSLNYPFITMAKDTTEYYLKLYKKYIKSGFKLPKFCDTRKPKVSYEKVRKAFSRLKKSGKIKDKEQTVSQKTTKKKTKSVDIKKKCKKKTGTQKKKPTLSIVPKKPPKKSKTVSHRQQKLIEQELSTEGKTNKEMAKAAGYKAANLSRAFIQARESQVYQDALSKSKAALRKKLGIPGEKFLTRMAEVALSRPSDLIELVDGEISIRSDVNFGDGADLAIKSITLKSTETITEGMTETRKEFKFEPADNQAALNSVIRIGGYFDDSVFNSMAGGDVEILELWRRFKKTEITANDLSMELAMRGLEVPKPVQLQAKAELVKLAKDSGDGDSDNIDLMESYDEMLEDAAIAKKKYEVEQKRKEELAEREKELDELNVEDDKDIIIHADQDYESDEG